MARTYSRVRRPSSTRRSSSTAPIYQRPSRRRRFAARGIDLLVVFLGSLFLYWGAAFLYYLFAGCTSGGFTDDCGDSAIGSYVAIGIFTLAFAFPLIYESLFHRTPGKHLLKLDIVNEDRQLALRSRRLKRSFAVWVPVLALLAGTAEASGSLSSLIGTLLLLYAVALAGAVIAGGRPSHDWFAGTEVVWVPSEGDED